MVLENRRVLSKGGSDQRVVRFGKIDKAYIQRNSFIPRQLLKPTNYTRHIGMVRSETTLFHWQDLYALALLTEAASDDLQQYLAGVRYQRNAPPVVVALRPILLFVEYHDDNIFSLLRHLSPPPNTNGEIEQFPAQGGITVEGDLEQLNGDSVRSDSLSVRQIADRAFQLLHRGLNSYRHVLGSLVKVFCDVRVKLR